MRAVERGVSGGEKKKALTIQHTLHDELKLKGIEKKLEKKD
jgi:hypothetical protein